MRAAVWAIAGTLGILVVTPAWAHVGVGSISGFSSGVVHPLSGADHWVAMVAVGIWARFVGGRGMFAVPLGFVVFMVVGGVAGRGGGGAHWSETGIVASLAFLGLLLVAAVRLPAWSGAVLAALFAFFHGHAHGAEIPPGAAPGAYVLGFVSTTALLHLLGIFLGEGLLRAGGRLQRRDLLVRLAGLAVLGLGMGGVLA